MSYEEMKTKEWIGKLDVIRAEVEEMILDEEFREDLNRYPQKMRGLTIDDPLADILDWHDRYVDANIEELIDALENIQRIYDESQIPPEPEDDDDEEEDEDD